MGKYYSTRCPFCGKTKDFVSRSKQRMMTYPTDVTAVILNEARRLIPELWDGRSKALKFSCATGEQALRAAKTSVREGSGLSMARSPLQDGTDCFEVRDAEGKVIEQHMVVRSLM